MQNIHDDWDAHWTDYAESAAKNPSQEYRRRLILSLIDKKRDAGPLRILDIGSDADLSPRYQAARVIDATGRAILPGLINLHTHSSMILFRGLADDYSLATWGEALAPLHREFDETPGLRLAADRLAVLAILKSGTTTFVEMYHYPEMVAAVASGLLRYPFMICGPRTQTSPSCRGGKGSPVSKLAILHSVLGAGTPTDPNLTRSGSAGDECVTGLVSVMP